MLKFSRTLGIRDTSQTIIRWGPSSKPSLGGISFFIIFLLTLIITPFIVGSESYFFNIRLLGIILATTLGFLLGLCDDAYNTSPLLKFFTQMLCAFILFTTGTYISIFDVTWLNYAITILWVIGLMNSINMLDNMDGITTVVSISILGAILLSIILRNDLFNPMAIMVVGVMASLTGFLFFNWHPSKMYMGDTGSQFLGVLLAALGINFFWNGMGFAGQSTPLERFFSVIIVFAIPLIDTATVTIKRILQGRSPIVGGKDHTTHHISYLGLNDQQVAIVFAALSLLSMIFALVITNFTESWTNRHTIGFGLYFLVLFGTLFTFSLMNREKKHSKP